ncbi:MAG: metal-dependent hydrolase [Bilophila wadsworthia]
MDVFFTAPRCNTLNTTGNHPFVRRRFGARFAPCPHPWLMNRWRVPKVPDDSPPFGWPLPLAWLTAYLLILHHIFGLHESYGTQVFLPFSDYRVRLNALFIVDPLLLLPLALGLIFWRKRRAVMIGLLLWTILIRSARWPHGWALGSASQGRHYTPDVSTQELL